MPSWRTAGAAVPPRAVGSPPPVGAYRGRKGSTRTPRPRRSTAAAAPRYPCQAAAIQPVGDTMHQLHPRGAPGRAARLVGPAAALLLAACGGGGGGSGGSAAPAAPTPTPAPSAPAPTQAQAFAFLKQATFGPLPSDEPLPGGIS